MVPRWVRVLLYVAVIGIIFISGFSLSNPRAELAYADCCDAAITDETSRIAY